jgi:predicted O-methyltransferase YrrM
VEPSAVASLDDDPARASERLLDIAEAAISAARKVVLDDLSARITSGPKWPDFWPGEHYKLLTALVQVTGAKRVVEIGTYRGLGALALLEGLPDDGTIATFDIVPYTSVSTAVLVETDFGDGRLRQILADITTDAGFADHRELLSQADLIFTDAAKDGSQERVFLQRFEQAGFTNAPLVIFDDIRLQNMLQIWRDIRRPKLDLTSFGHWSGTGLVDYS